MRIIGGHAKGLRLHAPEGYDVRPTPDRVKESLFAMLGNVTDATVVDLFAGSGALGLEALSRGAATVLFVEREPRHTRILEQNLAAAQHSLNRQGLFPETRVILGDALRAHRLLHEWKGAVDLILADPPYHPTPPNPGAAELLACADFANWAGDGLLALEHATDAPLPWHPLGPWHLLRQKRYGRTVISLAEIHSDSGP